MTMFMQIGIIVICICQYTDEHVFVNLSSSIFMSSGTLMENYKRCEVMAKNYHLLKDLFLNQLHEAEGNKTSPGILNRMFLNSSRYLEKEDKSYFILL